MSSFREIEGKPLHEAAHVAFALQKVAGTWLIAG
jgi:hypothetical protein